MRFSDTELRELAGRATALHRRWQGRRGQLHAGVCDSAAAGRLERWRYLLSVDGDAEILARRLAWDGLDVQACLPALGFVRLAGDVPLPNWAERLNRILGSLPSPGDLLSQLSGESLPFVDVWLSFVAGATDDLRSRAGTALKNLTEDALRGFQAELLCTLSHLGALPLSLEFRRFIARDDPLSAFKLDDAGAVEPSRDQYHRFVRDLCTGGLLSFFQEYAVLARLVMETAEHWAEHVCEFCTRIDDDRAELTKLFNAGLDPGPVIDVDIGLSDPHHGRRVVIIPTFASGLKVVYKPKDLSIDEAFWSFVEWLNRQPVNGERLPLRRLAVLNRSTHGWVEFVEHEGCRDRDAVQRYYRRIGMLLCVAYVLGATDFHQENIIASGEQPLLLDLETMLQPMSRSFDGLRTSSADQRALEVLHDSVLRVGLLPFWIAGDRGKSYDVSGIGAEEPPDTGRLEVHWQHLNTDGMQLDYRSFKSHQPIKRPMLTGRLASARDYVGEIIDGFTAVYRILLARRSSLLDEDGLLSRFRGVKLRYLLRMTKAYSQLLSRRLHPEFLREGADAGLEMERLARDFLLIQPDTSYPAPWGIFRAEAEALERLDIPLFTFLSDSETLFADGCPVAPHFFSETGMQRVASTIRKLSEEDLRVQADFIRASLHARYTAGAFEGQPARADAGIPASSPQRALTPEQFIDAASSIAEQIRAAAIRGSGGGVTWLSMAFDPIVRRTNFLPMTDSLYDGRIGVAFFLAALEHVTGGAGFRDLALEACAPLRNALGAGIRPAFGRSTLGGAAGLGGQIYALTRVAAWLSNEELLRLAARAAGWFTPKRVERDESLDVFGGAAGGILGLLTLPDDDGSDALEAAVRCGDHLLQKRVVADTGHRVWRGSWVPRPLTGFGHGAAGFAYALLRVSQASGEPRFREAAEEAIDYETAVYAAGARNWPDFRANRGSLDLMVAWCNGAAGIGLGRLGGLVMFDTGGVREDIANALATTRTAALSGEDHLCCGNMGRLDFLIESSRRLGRLELLDEARQRASTVVRRAAQNNSYKLLAQAPGMTDSLSLFQGTAGIGYQLLRLAHPDRLPCVLIWE